MDFGHMDLFPFRGEKNGKRMADDGRNVPGNNRGWLRMQSECL